METILNIVTNHEFLTAAVAVWGVITTAAAGLAKIFPKAGKLSKVVHLLAVDPNSAK